MSNRHLILISLAANETQRRPSDLLSIAANMAGI